MIEYFGYFAGFLTVASFLPQVIRTGKPNRCAISISDVHAAGDRLLHVDHLRDNHWIVARDPANIGMVVLNGAIAIAKVLFG